MLLVTCYLLLGHHDHPRITFHEIFIFNFFGFCSLTNEDFGKDYKGVEFRKSSVKCDAREVYCVHPFVSFENIVLKPTFLKPCCLFRYNDANFETSIVKSLLLY